MLILQPKLGFSRIWSLVPTKMVIGQSKVFIGHLAPMTPLVQILRDNDHGRDGRFLT